VILVGVRQKAGGRGQKEEEEKISTIKALLGLQNICITRKL